MTSKTTIGVSTVAGAIILLLAGCGSNSASTSKQTITIGMPSDIETMDQSHAADTTGMQVLENTDEGLLMAGKDGKAKKGVASKVTKSKDGKTYTFTLRHDSKWNDGTTVTAQDFVYGWRRTVDPKTAGEYAYLYAGIKNANDIMNKKKAPSTLGIRADGKYKLTVTLENPISYFEKLIEMPTFYPQEQKVVEKYGKDYGSSASKIAYNGPFKLTKWDGTSDSWTLTKNTNYWDKKAVKLSSVKMQVIKDPTTGMNLYNSKKVDMVTLGGNQVATEKSKPGFTKVLGGTITYLQPNLKNPTSGAAVRKAFNNQDIRRALSLIMNRKEFVSKVLRDGSTPAKGLVTDNILKSASGEDFTKASYVKEAVSYNKAEAVRLFKKGMKEIGETKLNILLLCDDDTATSNIAEYVQSQLANNLPGMNVTINKVPKTTRVDRLFKGNFDLAITSWGADYSDPSSFLNLFETSNSMNFGHYNSKSYDANVKIMNTTADDSKRWDAMVAAEKTLMKDQPFVPMYQKATSYMINPKIKNLHLTTAGPVPSYKGVYVSK